MFNFINPSLLALSSDLTPLRESGSLLTDRVITDGVIIMVVGFSMVFLVLGIFYFLIRLLNAAFPGDSAKKKRQRQAVTANAEETDSSLFGDDD